jgi:hypothetical protein
MTGTVMNQPVKYAAEGAWTLQGQFLSLHMKDVAVPPAYEANLLIGIDSSKMEYVAHWLDSFGGAGARVVGLGPITAEGIEIIYPYAEHHFRNTFNYSADTDEWTLVIESAQKDGGWSIFAKYRIVKK